MCGFKYNQAWCQTVLLATCNLVPPIGLVGNYKMRDNPQTWQRIRLAFIPTKINTYLHAIFLAHPNRTTYFFFFFTLSFMQFLKNIINITFFWMCGDIIFLLRLKRMCGKMGIHHPSFKTILDAFGSHFKCWGCLIVWEDHYKCWRGKGILIYKLVACNILKLLTNVG